MALALLLGVPLLAACPGTPTPTQRPGSAHEGSAHWAQALAQPELTALAPDAQLYLVLGALVYKDGRLSSDVGTWSFVAWSPSQQKKRQVTVKYDGTLTTSDSAATSAPSHNDQPLPAGWANSTNVFSVVAPHLAGGANHAPLVVLNTTSYPQAPDEAVWGINYNVGGNHLVKADGTYIGPQ